jgi:hypothetical protein
MKIRRRFSVRCPRDTAVELACSEDALLGLFPDPKTEILDRKGDRITLCSHYTAMGREGTATFHFDFLMDGNLRFEKVCDGNVWRELRGDMEFEELGDDQTEVSIRMEGRTRTLVPEITIKGPMEEQIDAMATALRARFESAGGGA